MSQKRGPVVMDKINQQAFDMRTVLVLEIFGKPNTKELLETKKIMIDILVISQNIFCGDWGKKRLFKYSKTIHTQTLNLYCNIYMK